MIPLRDKNPTSSFPIITLLLILVNAYVFFTNTQSGQLPYEMIPRDVVTGQEFVGIAHITPDGHMQFDPEPLKTVENTQLDPKTDIPVLPRAVAPWMTIFTAMFLHANFLHIAGNMLFLWIFGNNVEDALGKFRYLIFYFGCGIMAAVAQIAVDPTSLIPTLGASGAIAGVLGAYIIMWPGARVSTLIFLGIFITLADISAFWVIGIWIALQIIEGVTGLGGMATGGVAYFAHIGGFITGVVVTILMGGRALGEKQMRIASYARPRLG
jgi:membrane associated rhomboid family serine protease